MPEVPGEHGWRRVVSPFSLSRAIKQMRMDSKQESVLTYTLPPRIIRPNRQLERGS